MDTHIFLWLNNAPENLSSKVLDNCEDTSNELYLSMVSPWEIQIKQQLGKLDCVKPLHVLVETQQRQNGLQILPITLGHIYTLANLPMYHNDPFDRLLIAQAITESMKLVTVDKNILKYSVATLS